ncbi:PucR family transcriptional regulator [Saccharibacillus alkalitolerans]|uniref:PucR family transcriptional regulator n=1 Tax=Saccharibacillus alkalitolerans TaxID=2705290 RepID=A0ABX0FAP5_9BACL|nr:helix-turn-helix domain-containing protein [Saccharibacillus alkalitolerans]NGZ77119.1 PucR family transcriptional regulator [Saccharibacillus alkalitolerans]
MNVQEIRSRLESIVGRPVELIKIENSPWQDRLKAVASLHAERAGDRFSTDGLPEQGTVEAGSTWFFAADTREATEERLAVRIADDRLEPSVRELISLLVQSASLDAGEPLPERETEVQQLGRWLAERMERGESPQELPDTLLLKNRLFAEMIPFLLICEGAQNSLGGYEELHQLLSTFLEREVLVIPLHDREWLLLVDRLDVMQISEERDEEEESDRELLEAFGLGLYELIASEWAGIFNLSVSEPLQPAYGLVPALRLLKESVFLGKTFHVTRNVHLPWELGLERLVYSVPAKQRERFMEEIEGRAVVLEDSETLTTLETFFRMNCNVSETAKRLYIHRNTLIYRLDKVKQETGLDVRNFGDAVLMRLAVLLDKVTKD